MAEVLHPSFLRQALHCITLHTLSQLSVALSTSEAEHVYMTVTLLLVKTARRLLPFCIDIGAISSIMRISDMPNRDARKSMETSCNRRLHVYVHLDMST
jgi:hypothetical protein